MSDASDEVYDVFEDMAEAYERLVAQPPKIGGGRKKVGPVGRVRQGGVAWGQSEKVCPKSCTKKCCAVNKN
jgi:hypothetical protein